jgi:hypothetical protein
LLTGSFYRNGQSPPLMVLEDSLYAVNFTSEPARLKASELFDATAAR